MKSHRKRGDRHPTRRRPGKRSTELLPCVIALLMLIGWLQATSEGQESAESARIDSASPSPRKLADGSYADRQKATLEMWRRRNQSRQAVQDASRNPDPEIAERAEWILRQWRNGAVPGVGMPPAGFNANGGQPSTGATAIAAVLESGMFEAALVAVEESAGTIEYEQIKSRLERLIVERFPIYVDRASAVGSEVSLLRLVDVVASDRRLAQASNDLRAALGIDESDDQLAGNGRLPQVSLQWPETERDIALAQLAMSDGKATEAIELVRESGDEDLLRITQMVAGRWDLIAKDALRVVDQFKAKKDDQSEPSVEIFSKLIPAYSWALAASYRQGDQTVVDRLVDELRGLDQFDRLPTEQSESLKDLRWRTLAVHNRVDDAIDILAGYDTATAAEIATAASRYDRAFELCGYPRGELQFKLSEWMANAYRAQAELPAGQLAPEISRLYAFARLLLYCGDTETPLTIYQQLDAKELMVDRNGMTLKDQTLFEISRAGRLDWLVELAVAEDEKRVGRQTFLIVTNILETDDLAFGRVMQGLKTLLPGLSFRDRFQATCNLFRGMTPEGFDPDRDFDRLFDFFINYRKVESQNGRMQQRDIVVLDSSLIDMFEKNGQAHLVRKGFRELAQRGNAEALRRLAETELEFGSAAQANKLWKLLLDRAGRFDPNRTAITQDHCVEYGKSLVGLWLIALQNGHHAAAAELEKRLRLMLCSPSLKFRFGVASHLRSLGQHAFASEILRKLVILTSFAVQDAPDFYDVAIAYSGVIEELNESSPGSLETLNISLSEASLWNDRVVFGLMQNVNIMDTFFVGLPMTSRKRQLEDAIRKNDADRANQLVKEIENLDPLDIDFAERMLPVLRKAGMNEIADGAFNRLMDRGAQHVAKFPLDATTLNNLAWTAAVNRRRLEEALRLSDRAVMLEPDSVVFRDTLAEVLHHLGKTEEAIKIETACLIDSPDEWHLHEQIRKYREEIQ